MIAPAARNRRTTSAPAVASGTGPDVPNLVGVPATSTSSFTAIGMPSNGRYCPAARLRSASRASARAWSVMTTRNAFSVDWLAVVARCVRWTSSSDVTLLLASWYSCWVRVGNRLSARGLGGVVGENSGGVVGVVMRWGGGGEGGWGGGFGGGGGGKHGGGGGGKIWGGVVGENSAMLA